MAQVLQKFTNFVFKESLVLKVTLICCFTIQFIKLSLSTNPHFSDLFRLVVFFYGHFDRISCSPLDSLSLLGQPGRHCHDVWGDRRHTVGSLCLARGSCQPAWGSVRVHEEYRLLLYSLSCNFLKCSETKLNRKRIL